MLTGSGAGQKKKSRNERSEIAWLDDVLVGGVLTNIAVTVALDGTKK
jgi:hypothetical protein